MSDDSKTDTVKPVDEGKQAIRKQLLFGVNQVTRGLEKDDVRLVITCRSAQPVIITRHLIGLASLRKCPAICISDLNKSVCEAMNLTSAVAVGFKKTPEGREPHVFDDLVEFITKHVPETSLPWLHESSTTRSDMETSVSQTAASVDVKCQTSVCEIEASDKSGKNGSADVIRNKSSEGELREMTESPIQESSHKHVTDIVKSYAKPGHQSKVVDYSHFYVYKSEVLKPKSEWPEFIQFSSEPSMDIIDYKDMACGKGIGNPNQISVKYENVSVQRIPPNPDRKKRKRKLKM